MVILIVLVCGLAKYLKKKSFSLTSLHRDSMCQTNQLCTLGFLKLHVQYFNNYTILPFHHLSKAVHSEHHSLQTSQTCNSCLFPKPGESRVFTNSKCGNVPNISSIVMLGDSNGGHYFRAAIRWLTNVNWKCAIIRGEVPSKPYLPDPRYFVRKPLINLQDIRYHRRDCHGCSSMTSHCTKLGRNLTIELIALEFLLDSEVTTFRSVSNGSCKLGRLCEYSTTYQEFIFKEYLKGRYPDVIVYFASVHDMIRFNLLRIRMNFDFFFNLMDYYAPSNITVVAANLMKINVGLLSPVLRKARYEDGLGCNEVIWQQNQIMFDILRERLINTSKNWYLFPSLYDGSSTTDHLYRDGVHRNVSWYDYVSRGLLYLFCL